ncbi:hypothetical protein Back11_10850 [Paenibacillus baekrokdamisoli]|uniref:Uncharacterized protein n=1 Tax=Paenibacillus baekrokdamisoli TaxID=1712516 RepID=A0A3G9ILN5_9BACL|nr:hypothetical protein Back11_10850 [Paenibacillus baekrokdamisoli]
MPCNSLVYYSPFGQIYDPDSQYGPSQTLNRDFTLLYTEQGLKSHYMLTKAARSQMKERAAFVLLTAIESIKERLVPPIYAILFLHIQIWYFLLMFH